MDLAELLAAGKVEEFNEQRGRRATVDLFGADLADARLPGVDLSGANLEKADLSKADLTDSVLVKANLSGADLTGAQMANAMGIRLQLREAYLGEADLSECDLSAADFSEAELPGANLKGATLRGARFKRADASKVNFDDCDFTEARMSGANLAGATFAGAILREAELRGCDLSGANLAGADLVRSRLTEARLIGADLTGANLSQADLTGADLTGARLKGAILRRADLTEAVLVDVALDEADLSEAQLDGERAALTMQSSTPAATILIEEPMMAGSADHVAAIWDNPEPDGRPRLCAVVGHAREGRTSDVTGLPVPTDLVVARALAAHGDAFVVLALLERPGGVVASFLSLDAQGAVTPMLSCRLPYTPAARPILAPHPAGPILYGISREGPGLQVHRVKPDGLERLHASAMPTVRGFVSDRLPLVLSKGGVLVRLTPRGVSNPMRAAEDFPGRRCAACLDGDDVVLAWIPKTARGFRTTVLSEGRATEPTAHQPKSEVGSIDVVSAGGQTWVAFTTEPPTPDQPAEAWALNLGKGTPFPVVQDEDKDAGDVKLVEMGDAVGAAVTYIDGTMELFRLSEGRARSVWHLG